MKNSNLVSLSLLAGLIATFSGNIFAQTTLKPHFTDESKKIVIPKEATVFPEIHEGLIAIYNRGNIYYVNMKGEYVFGSEFPFTRGNDFYNSAYFSGGAMMAWRRKDYSQSPFIIYPDGKYRDLPNDVQSATSFVDGYAIIWRGSSLISMKQVYIDKNGKEVFPALTSVQRGSQDLNVYPVCENRRLYYNSDIQKYGYADEKGTIVIKPQYDKAANFSDGMAAVMIKEGYTEKWGFIDLTGKMVVPTTYRLKPGRFSEGWAVVRIGESESDFESAYIDKTGKRVMENKPWSLNEFHDGYAWVATGCDKLFVMNKQFEEVRDLTKDFYHHGNGFGVCMFKMISNDAQKTWGFDFPNGMQTLNQGGKDAGDIFTPDGKIVYTCVDAKGNRVNLHAITEGDLMFCQLRFQDEPRLKEKDVYLSCFINQKGEVVYFFEGAVEGYEGKKPVQVK